MFFGFLLKTYLTKIDLCIFLRAFHWSYWVGDTILVHPSFNSSTSQVFLHSSSLHFRLLSFWIITTFLVLNLVPKKSATKVMIMTEVSNCLWFLVPPRKLTLQDATGATIHTSYIGPLHEGDIVKLSCIAMGGRYRYLLSG